MKPRHGAPKGERTMEIVMYGLKNKETGELAFCRIEEDELIGTRYVLDFEWRALFSVSSRQNPARQSLVLNPCVGDEEIPPPPLLNL